MGELESLFLDLLLVRLLDLDLEWLLLVPDFCDFGEPELLLDCGVPGEPLFAELECDFRLIGVPERDLDFLLPERDLDFLLPEFERWDSPEWLADE